MVVERLFGLMTRGTSHFSFNHLLYSPRSCPVDGVTIHFEPLSNFPQPFLINGYDPSVSGWSDIHYHVATAAYRLNQRLHKFLRANYNDDTIIITIAF